MRPGRTKSGRARPAARPAAELLNLSSSRSSCFDGSSAAGSVWPDGVSGRLATRNEGGRGGGETEDGEEKWTSRVKHSARRSVGFSVMRSRRKEREDVSDKK